MTTNLNASDYHLNFALIARLANKEPLSDSEKNKIRQFLDRSGGSSSDASGFPEAPTGDTGDLNSLRRTNWFNGRYLTAEALSRQDVYFDHRARLNVHALMPGIAWGLGIAMKTRKASASQTHPTDDSGFINFGMASDLTLKRGLAFDGVGRPILVSRDFDFSLDDLIGVAQKTPRRVVGGQREFMPCVCLAPDPGGPSGGSPALPSGPFLLVIEAGERPQGKAKVTGDVCGGRSSAPCEADVWQGSFGLSLVRFPVDVPLDEGSDPWALRGTLSAYYFDAFEHPLWQRWNPNFPVDASFTSDSGPERQEGLAIPLALVHLDGKGAALFLDSWIPRRLMTATPGEDWHRTRFGAPPRAAAWARIHQFQAMLAESLKQRPMGQGEEVQDNLFVRGFRHIPPIGFLPVVPRSTAGQTHGNDIKNEVCIDLTTLDNVLNAEEYTKKEVKFQVANGSLNFSSGLAIVNNTCIITPLSPANSARIFVKTLALKSGVLGDELARIVVKGLNQSVLSEASINEALDPKEYDFYGLEEEIASIEIIPGKNIKYIAIVTMCCFSFDLQRRALPDKPPRSKLAYEALRQAQGYFAGTNVFTYGVIALHDDDILEDLHNVIDKDPLQLEKREQSQNKEQSARLGQRLNNQLATLPSNVIRNLAKTMLRYGLSIDAVVNRHVEVVKLIVPLEGLSRQYPLVEFISKDAQARARAWRQEDVLNSDAAKFIVMPWQPDVGTLPRSFVVYVKQRVTLLDLLFLLLEEAQAPLGNRLNALLRNPLAVLSRLRRG